MVNDCNSTPRTTTMPPTNTAHVKFLFMRAIISHPADGHKAARRLRA